MTVQVPETDYSDASLWAYRPEVHEKDVDVFFVAPTVVGGEEYNMDMADEKNRYNFTGATEEVSASFEYYMKHYNEGRGVILAGFSQGGDMVKRLLYPSLKMAEGEYDTGVIVSFCSESEDMTASIIVPGTTNGINPLNWKTDDTRADKKENLGACFTDYDGNIKEEIPGLCGAYLDEERGTLKVMDVTPQEYPGGLSFLADGNYHLYDYQFFYRNLEQNVQSRIESYLSQ